MDQQVQTIVTVIKTLRGLFENKDRLVGVNDWDSFIGCLIALESVANEIKKEE